MAIEFDPRTDYYVTLGIEDSATVEDIKKAHRVRIRDLHPDHGGDSARACAVNLARDVLGEPSTRREYDRARRAWFMAILKDPGVSAFVDHDGRLAAHFTAQQRAEDAADAFAARAQPRTTAAAPPSDAERTEGHARKWQWGLVADFAWPDVRKALLSGDWLQAITWLGTALFVDRAIEVGVDPEQLAYFDAFVAPRQRERMAALLGTMAQVIGTQCGLNAAEPSTRVRQAVRNGTSTTARAGTSRQSKTRRRKPDRTSAAPR